MPFCRFFSGRSSRSLGPHSLADGVPHRVADDGAHDDHGEHDLEVHAALRRQHAAHDGGRLAREDEAEHHGRLGEDQETDEGVGRPAVQRQQRLEQAVDQRLRRSVHGAQRVLRGVSWRQRSSTFDMNAWPWTRCVRMSAWPWGRASIQL